MKISERGIRLCDQSNCELPATHTCVWADEWTCQCMIHMQALLNLAQIMGHPVPHTTLRVMTPDEMLPDDESEGA